MEGIDGSFLFKHSFAILKVVKNKFHSRLRRREMKRREREQTRT